MYSLIISIFSQIQLPFSIDITMGEIMFILMGFFWVFYKNIQIDYKSDFFKFYIIPNILFILYIQLYSFVNQENIYENIKMTIKYMEIISITFLFYFMKSLNVVKIGNLLYLLPLATILTTLFEYYQVSNTMYSFHMTGSLLSIFYILLVNKIKFNRYIKFSITLLTLLFLYLGDSRTGIIIILIYFILEISFRIYTKNNNKLNVLLKFIYMLFSINLMIYIYGKFLNNISEDTASNIERTGMLNLSLMIFKENPMIGIGPGNFSEKLVQNSNLFPYTTFESMETLQPHNVFVEILVTYGLIGLIIYSIPILFLIIQTAKWNRNKLILKNNSAIFGILSMVVIVFFTSVLSGEYRFIISILISYLFYKYQKKNEEDEVF